MLCRRPLKQVHQISGPLIWCEKGDDDLPPIAAALAAQALADLSQGVIVAQMRAQLQEA
jgi:hypothetical protein